jgi:hypothetical protein
MRKYSTHAATVAVQTALHAVAAAATNITTCNKQESLQEIAPAGIFL